MSHHLDFRRGRAACVAILVCLALAAIPIAAKASSVGLGTAQPFVVLSGAGAQSGPGGTPRKIAPNSPRSPHGSFRR